MLALPYSQSIQHENQIAVKTPDDEEQDPEDQDFQQNERGYNELMDVYSLH